jgi:hypothetical protein
MKRREYITLLVVAAGIWPSVRVLPSLILTFNRDVGLWHFCEVPTGSETVCLSG